jgi:hypothetical protein
LDGPQDEHHDESARINHADDAGHHQQDGNNRNQALPSRLVVEQAVLRGSQDQNQRARHHQCADLNTTEADFAEMQGEKRNDGTHPTKKEQEKQSEKVEPLLTGFLVWVHLQISATRLVRTYCKLQFYRLLAKRAAEAYFLPIILLLQGPAPAATASCLPSWLR